MTPTIIKGIVVQTPTPAHSPKPEVVLDCDTGLRMRVPITNWLIEQLPPMKVGDALLITAICDADNRIMDALTVLHEAPPR